MTRREALGICAVGAAASGAGIPRASPAPAAEDNTRPVSVLYYGADAPPPRSIDLQAGPLRMVLEPELAFVRYIKYADREVLRGIYAPVRDRNWGTVAPKVRNLRVETAASGFRAAFEVDCQEGPIDFGWKGSIAGDSSGVVRFTFDGEARSTFLRNRIGFCVLHPIAECAGRPCAVEKVDGSKEDGRFPDDISPHQPFVDVRAISHEVEPGVMAEVRFEGDTFEMEDQRNWTDASYKTYCTPLRLPFPVEVKAGTRVSQAVTVKLTGRGKAAPGPRLAAAEIVVRVGDAARAAVLPVIGLGIAAESPEPTAREQARLRTLRPAHLRVDLRLTDQGYLELLRRAAREAAALGSALEAAVFVTDAAEEELQGLERELASMKPKVARWLVFHEKEQSTGDRWTALARRYLRGPLGAGTNANFTELNRGRPNTQGLDVICYSANPQVHAFDNLSLVETFEGLRHTARSARQFTGSAKLAVTPVTLRQRFNPVATAVESGPAGDRLPPSVDARQASLFGAGWTLGSLQALAESGVDFATFYETTGWRGVMENESGSRMPALFPSTAGGVFPLYHVLADVAEFAGGRALPVRRQEPLMIAGMFLRQGGRSRLLVANLGPAPRMARVENSGLGWPVRIRRLDEHSYREAGANPEAYRKNGWQPARLRGDAVELGLLPYEYVAVDPA
ncbi:MAG: hypothetical protein KIT09_29780 [Bryobacteraceae bacterium]|nr:hypothetical protein [Bryobacteraceae bacterium]